ncbi:xanthine dehydrogenase family protein molybdopterin-binding subunit [Roseomonas sp. KE2513]|uniref:xanthine dehydrogenase family protein molybdopterin-binding subunit n=1 Tax=Roseomonas sp. KE2513 TaxID=2479202 RepID=UPI0018DFF7A6|nr:xanthine dehydrogenase family protein molybdopterin-binding subunit [Roseomonas sp. KE2513]MBI0535193.1 xanthine dehydrogenase family protein molybdopterin-binding subunit [Roseomonas sp. KE2513]
MERNGIGQPLRRREDTRLLTGRGRYTDDIDPPGCAQAVILRSPHAHARILAIRIEVAAAAPGVCVVLTGHDAAADGLGRLVTLFDVPGRDAPLFDPGRDILQTEYVRYVGDPVVLIVAETRQAAQDAAELVEIDYEPLPAVTDTAAAAEPGAPLVWPGRPDNTAVLWDSGRAEEVEDAFRAAHRTVSVSLVNNRMVANPMEPRVAIGEWDEAARRYLFHGPSQGTHRVRDNLAKHALKVPPAQLRVVSPDVGGGFGARGKLMPENALVLWAARRLSRPVKWLAGRTETFQSDPHGRDQVTRAEMALDRDAKCLGVRIRTVAGMGAYLQDMGPRVPTTGGARIMGTVYDCTAINNQVRCVFTNTVPTDAFRGAGRPETAYIMERLFDRAAEAFGIGRDEIRRRNYIRPDQLPYRNAVGNLIDSGDFAGTQAMALELADWNGFPARRAASQARGRPRGIGLGYFIEASGGLTSETARLRVTPGGRVELRVGTFSHGQGHETAFLQVVADRLGIDPSAMDFIQGDSDELPAGNGTGGSRSSQMGGVAVLRASNAVVAKARRIAAHLLEAAPEDVELESGRFRVAGTDLGLDWPRVIAAAHDPAQLPEGEAPGLDELLTYTRDTECNFPNGCHVAEVEVDPETGQVTLARYAAVDDVGNVINPLLVHGQMHGGIMTGIGQALMEEARYDPESGQFLTSTFQDYCMPRAGDGCDFQLGLNVVPTPTNDLGVKGAGEGGACGAPPAIVSAVCDALGLDHIDMPLTPEKVWRALSLRESASRLAAE